MFFATLPPLVFFSNEPTVLEIASATSFAFPVRSSFIDFKPSMNLIIFTISPPPRMALAVTARSAPSILPTNFPIVSAIFEKNPRIFPSKTPGSKEETLSTMPEKNSLTFSRRVLGSKDRTLSAISEKKPLSMPLRFFESKDKISLLMRFLNRTIESPILANQSSALLETGSTKPTKLLNPFKTQPRDVFTISSAAATPLNTRATLFMTSVFSLSFLNRSVNSCSFSVIR